MARYISKSSSISEENRLINDLLNSFRGLSPPFVIHLFPGELTRLD